MKKLAVFFLTLLTACAGHVSEDPPEILVPPDSIPEECSKYSPLLATRTIPTQFPVEVVIDTGTSNHNISLVLDAIDAWNLHLGEEILYATITADLAGMHDMCSYTTVTTTKLLPDPWIGLATSGPCGASHVDIETMELHSGDGQGDFFTDRVVTLISIHELGHILGLPHEEHDPQSVMYPTLGDEPRNISDQSVCLVRLAIARSRSLE